MKHKSQKIARSGRSVRTLTEERVSVLPSSFSRLRTPCFVLLFSVFILLFPFFVTFAQIPIGTWQTHFNYLNTSTTTAAFGAVYAASEQGFFVYDTQAKQSIRLSKIDGFAENGIAQLVASEGDKLLMVAYKNGNLDLVNLRTDGMPEKITNLPLIKENTSIQGSKLINQIIFANKTAYLATDFGLVVFDLARNEIRDTYQNIGTNGQPLAVKGVAFSKNNDSLLVGTPQGILRAKISSNINLQYFGNWQTVFNKPIQQLITRNTDLFASVLGEGIYQQKAGRWTLIYPNISLQLRLSSSPKSANFWALLPNQLLTFDANNQLTIFNNTQLKNPQQATISGNVFVADYRNGLLEIAQNQTISQSPSSSDTLYRVRKDSIITDLDGNQWVRLGSSGILVRNQGKIRYLDVINTAGLPDNTINTLVLDKDGQIWVGTNRGVAVFSNTANVFKNAVYSAYSPIFQQRRLLGNDFVTAIAIDGGNRKWIGTPNGLFLFSADGTELLETFTEKNSPLPSNQIDYLAVEPLTGEVYVRTAAGMVSYRGTATEAPDTQVDENVLVFPNPVRPNFNGTVGISGLTENAFVKITDTAGRLVFETRANGGTAVWNTRMLSGETAEAGIYLIFSTDTKGKETLVSKLAVVR